MNVMSRHDKSQLEEVLEAFRPQLIIGGPLYKMMDEVDSNLDRDTAKMQSFLNGIRRRWGCAMILEHHAPTGGKEGREIRSKGGQRWDAWTNCTVALRAKEGVVSVGYPHPPRGKFQWPRTFKRGTANDLPWIASYAATRDDPPPSDSDAPPEEPF